MKENISNNYLMDKPIDRITKDEFENGETYLNLMKKNIIALKEALN